MLRLSLAALALILAALAGFVGYRTANFAMPPPAADALANVQPPAIDMSAATIRLGQAIRFRTVSLVTETDDRAQFEQFHAFLQTAYPAFHAAAQRELIGELSLLYTWEGSDPAQPPIILLAHQDVVPVEEQTRATWRFDPFGGVVADDAIWGRGSMDDKSSLMAILEAAELLAARGARPTRTIIFAFGHDEEIGGAQGAVQMAALLQQRYGQAWFALDEGSLTIARHPLTGGPAALIGISEKGSGTLRITATGQPGHSSMPPRETAVSRLALAVTAIHDMHIDHSIEGGPALDMMRALAPEMSLTNRVAISNEWLFAPLLQNKLANDPAAQALLGTTVAPTMIEGGVRPNVLPAQAIARINLRIHPRDTSADLLRRARQAVADLDGVTVQWDETPDEASPVSATDSSSYALLAGLSRQVMPEAPPAPALVVGATDARHYEAAAQDVYRYQAILVTPEELEGFHGVNERMSIENYRRMIQFYAGLMQAGAMAPS